MFAFASGRLNMQSMHETYLTEEITVPEKSKIHKCGGPSLLRSVDVRHTLRCKELSFFHALSFLSERPCFCASPAVLIFPSQIDSVAWSGQRKGITKRNSLRQRKKDLLPLLIFVSRIALWGEADEKNNNL